MDVRRAGRCLPVVAILAAGLATVSLPAPRIARAATIYPFTTQSIYEHDSTEAVLFDQGCTAARGWPQGSRGLVILDFGRLMFDPATRRYGASDFGPVFVPNSSINRWMQAYARGFHACIPGGFTGRLILARGTSNYNPAGVPNHRAAGKQWAKWTMRLNEYMAQEGFIEQSADAADDIESQWDPDFQATKDFLDGYAATTSRWMWNYGGFPPGWWTLEQQYQTAGVLPTVPAPEVYYSSQASNWSSLARWAVDTKGKKMFVWAVMSQYPNGGYSPHEAYDEILRQLNGNPDTSQSAIPFLTQIGGLSQAQLLALRASEGV